ncbi:glycoside hydrolase family 2 protein [Sphingomonas sp. KR1UV-12]|uniref:Beta-mannosidase B n=1 Tax=Sphingomonas aurea TaxID=3063994 RepID=A0ABT9EL00_9SPHN|nr:glycoside hydrolase family 2 protein [Sphingomonas sp. KR1UV-12]MDP1027647.1 glycoside hydrolase family 2 protein [Sphingomonas sp. KR1UV-12]
MRVRAAIVLAALLLAAPAPALAQTDVMPLDRGWQVRIDPAHTAAARAHPRAARWLAATVPGTVQQDLIARHIVPDPFVGLNEAAIQWAGLTGWQYRRTLTVTPETLRRDRVELVFDGLDTFARVTVNGRLLLAADNAHRRWRADARAVLRPGINELVVTFASPIRTLQPMVLAEPHPLPGEYDSAFGDEPKGRQTSPYIRKPKYHYGWDWGPRIVAQGIWKPVRLEAWNTARIDALTVAQEAVSPAEARISANLSIPASRATTARVRVVATAPDGTRIAAERQVALTPGSNRVAVPLAIPRPAIWQPIGYGAQPLYTLAATIATDDGAQDQATRRTGLRTVELIREGGSFGVKVNGTPIFMKGANVIPFDNFPARVTAADQRRILTMAATANMNTVRVWGGGYYPDDAFYDIADELGLMVWQDFMFGGAVTPPDTAFRQNVAAEAAEQVERLQAHPSLVLWAGNNEVQSGWENWSDRKAFKRAVGADAQERIGTGMAVLFDRVLRDAVTRGDGDVPYWPGSPSTDYEGPIDTDADGDRHFWDVWSGSKPIARYTDACPRFMSEYGFQAMPGLPTIAAFAGDPRGLSASSPVMKAHQKFLGGEGNDRVLFYLAQHHRTPRDFADLVYLSQVMQADAIRTAALHHRACRPVTLGSLYWQLNDTWPAISWSSIDWFGRPKLLHHAARRFFAPEAILAERREGTTRIALISDRTTPLAARWTVRTMAMDGRELGRREGEATVPPLAALDVARLSDADLFADADPRTSYAVAELVVEGRTLSRAIVERAEPKDMAYPAAALRTAWNGRALTVTATRLARAVTVGFGTLPATPSDNGFDLLPGESVTVTIDGDVDTGRLRRALSLRQLGPN